MTDLNIVIQANHQAVSEFLARAQGIQADRWTTPRAPGKWSPAQVVEHVTKSYEGHRRMVQGKIPGKRAGLMGWAARTFFLPRLFKVGDFTQKGLKSPAFILPSNVPAPASELIPRLEAAASGLEADLNEAVAAGRTKMEHTFFGPLAPADLLQFVVIHTNHHRGQVVAAG